MYTTFRIYRYKLLLVKIGKECCKEIIKSKNFKIYEDFYESTIGAVKALTEINIAINNYKRDWEDKKEMEVLISRVKDDRIKDEFATKFGPLQRHGQMKFKRLKDRKFQENYYLMFFRFHILVFEIQEENILSRMKRRILSKMKSGSLSSVSYLVHRKSIDMAKTVSHYDQSSKILTLNVSNDDMSVNNDKSFDIIVPTKLNGDDLQHFINSVITRTTKSHQTHAFDTSVPKYDPFDVTSPSPMCGKCGLLIFGLLFRGYNCKTCNEYFHQECFENEEKRKIGKISKDLFIVIL